MLWPQTRYTNARHTGLSCSLQLPPPILYSRRIENRGGGVGRGRIPGKEVEVVVQGGWGHGPVLSTNKVAVEKEKWRRRVLKKREERGCSQSLFPRSLYLPSQAASKHYLFTHTVSSVLPKTLLCRLGRGCREEAKTNRLRPDDGIFFLTRQRR